MASVFNSIWHPGILIRALRLFALLAERRRRFEDVMEEEEYLSVFFESELFFLSLR